MTADPDDPSMKERLERLSKDLESRNKAAAPTGAPLDGPGSLGNAMSQGFRVLSEFAAAVVVGAVVGWQLDKWFGTSPGLLILFVALGTAAGFWSVYRTATKPTGLPGGPPSH